MCDCMANYLAYCVSVIEQIEACVVRIRQGLVAIGKQFCFKDGRLWLQSKTFCSTFICNLFIVLWIFCTFVPILKTR